MFGGLWQPSTLSYAVEQYFENGGRQAVVVRVVNGGAPATMSLPCGGETLTLEAQSPGSRETLRACRSTTTTSGRRRKSASISSCNACAPSDPSTSRTRRSSGASPSSRTRRVSSPPRCRNRHSSGFAVPCRRGARPHLPRGSRHPIGYIDSNPDGDDGAPLTDYDIIGSQQRGTGLFALRGTDFGSISSACRRLPAIATWAECPRGRVAAVPRPARAPDRGSAVRSGSDPAQALRGLRDLALQTEDALMCFPRVLAYDRLRGRYETFANCGAVAGVLARLEEQRPWWQPGPDEEILLRPGTRPVRMLNDAERAGSPCTGSTRCSRCAPRIRARCHCGRSPGRRGQHRRRLADGATALAAAR